MGISKKDAVRIAIQQGKMYQEKLSNQMLLVIYRDKMTNTLEYLEIVFTPDKYQHLTGLKLKDKNGQIRNNVALEFFHRCVGKPFITEREIEFSNPGTIDLKLTALQYITQITKITKMTGEFDPKSKLKLNADYILGGVNSCIGVSRYPDDNFYFPRTCLCEDITKISVYTSQVIAIFQKKISEKAVPYRAIKYVAKGVNLLNIVWDKDIRDKFILDDYKPPNK